METTALQLGIVGYVLAGFSFFILICWQLIFWRKRLNAPILFAFLFVSILWAVVTAYALEENSRVTIYTVGIELLRYSFAYLFLIQLSSSYFQVKNNTAYQWLIKVGFTTIVAMFVLLLYVVLSSAVNATFGFDLRIIGHIALAVIGLVLVEHLFRQSDNEHRWAIKFLCFSFFIMFTYDFYVYSDALLFRALDPNIWQARGFVYALSVPLLAIAISRSQPIVSTVSISRATVFYTTAIIFSAGYLILTSIGGFYLRAFGGDWGKVVAITFVFSAILVFFILIFSGHIRARVRVFIDKHFLEYKYDYREQWLGLIRELSLGSASKTLEERALHAVTELMDSATGCLWVKQKQANYVAVARLGMEELENLRESQQSSLATFLETWQWVINLDELRQNPEMYQGLTPPEWLVRLPNAWLIVPLMLQSQLYGFIVLSHSRSQKNFNWEDIDLLKTAGRQIAIHLAQETSSMALVEARQFEAFNRFSAYVVHDLKNLVSQLALVVKNAEKHKHNPEFMDDAIRTVDNSVLRMNKLLAQLRSDAMDHTLKDRIEINQSLQLVVQEKSQALPIPRIHSTVNKVYIKGDEARFIIIIGHLVQNAQDATANDGEINIQLGVEEKNVRLVIEDTGNGMDEIFIKERLFKPFDTTKGLTGMGIGAHESREFITELGGSMTVESEVGIGTRFILILPMDGYSKTDG